MDEDERAATLSALFSSDGKGRRAVVQHRPVVDDDSTRPQKYGNQRVEYDGYVFDSRAEFDHYLVLKLSQDAGEISDLVVHAKFQLQEGFKDRDGNRVPPIYYEADFTYHDHNGDTVVVDVKGFETPVWKLKKKLFLKRYPELCLKIVTVRSSRRRKRA